jgi:hypothetical protein
LLLSQTLPREATERALYDLLTILIVF